MVSKSDELTVLCRDYKAHGEPQSLRDLIVKRTSPMVDYLARGILKRIPAGLVELDELHSAGIVGVLDALSRFKHSRGVKFGTMAAFRIHGSMIDDLRQRDWAPRVRRTRAKRFAEQVSRIEIELGRKPSQHELMEALRMTAQGLFIIQSECEILAIQSLSGRSDDHRIRRIHRQDSDVEKEVFSRAATERVLETLRDKKERTIIVSYYFEGMTLKEIGKRLKLSESRTCQIHRELIKRLRKELDPATYAP